MKTGDWALARRVLTGGAGKLRAAIETAMRQEAEGLRNEIVQGITSQAPGGEPFKPLSPLTIATRKLKGRGGTKALIESASMRNSVRVVFRSSELAAFVGVPRAAGGGKRVSIAKLHEFGGPPVIQPITPKMRRFLFALYKKAGKEPDTDAAGRGVVVHQIPPRPFLRPAFARWSKGVKQRFHARVAKSLGWTR